MFKTYKFEEFRKIIEDLRSEDGCPWDREQTHTSLKPCMTEEAAELLSAIRIYDKTGDYENMKEELGDVLLQVMLHSEIAREETIFTIDDVITTVSEKMIRRHPHVFGNVNAEDTSVVLKNWEDIKKREKAGKTWIESELKEVPRELPSLMRAQKVLKKADKAYEPQNDYASSIKIMETSLKALKADIDLNKSELESHVGNILMEISNICRIKKLHGEQLLTDRIENLVDYYENA